MRHSQETTGDGDRLVPLDETQAALGDISRTTLWREIKSGALPTVSIRSRKFVRLSDIQAYIERHRS